MLCTYVGKEIHGQIKGAILNIGWWERTMYKCLCHGENWGLGNNGNHWQSSD